ncbi:MAG: phosphoserine phosphatase SerB [Rhizobiales bacterium]|nr:phosphoserine phosphatase SerB [Hyphomicrobiales bacterium]
MPDCVLTLIARPGEPALPALAERFADEFAPTAVAWLSPGEAFDLYVPGDLGDLRLRATALAAGAPADIAVQPAAGRRKRLFIADMDSTMIGQECIDELADFAGLKAKVADITERAMRGELDFPSALRERVGLLAGLPEETIGRVIVERITLTPGGRELVGTMRANGARTILVSGGFTAFTDRIAGMIGFDESHGNRLEIAAGRLTGRVAEPILGREAKLAALEDALARFGLVAEEALATGDGANDLLMVQRAGLGVAYHAKPALAAAADMRVDHGDLTALLFAQGYRRDEFATG